MQKVSVDGRNEEDRVFTLCPSKYLSLEPPAGDKLVARQGCHVVAVTDIRVEKLLHHRIVILEKHRWRILDAETRNSEIYFKSLTIACKPQKTQTNKTNETQ